MRHGLHHFSPEDLVFCLRHPASSRDVPAPKKFPWCCASLGMSIHPGDGHPSRVTSRAQGCSIQPLQPWYHLTQIAVFATEKRFSTALDRKSTRLNFSHMSISYAVFCLKKKSTQIT